MILRAAVGFAACTGLSSARGIPSAPVPPVEELHYHASCSVIDSDSLDGYVSNLSTDTYLVQGEVRFKFVSANSMSRPEIVVQTDSVIPAGKTVLISHARLMLLLLPGETCRFYVKDVIRKQ